MINEDSLILDALTKKFPQRDGIGEVVAVDAISLNIRKGEFVTLLGPSGCGKTTTLRLIAGFEMPTSGRILLNGKDITNHLASNREMAMVFQSYALFPHMSVSDNVAYGLTLRKLGRTEIKERVQNTLDMMGLSQLGKRRPNQLSGGQQQRVALARALVMEPSVMLFDEPLSNLDAKLRVQMRSEIHLLQRRLNVTSVYVTHDQVEAMALSDRIIVMNAGQIEQIGTPEEMYQFPATRFVADFIGRANFIELVVKEQSDDKITFDLLGKSVSVQSELPVTKGDSITVMLRPEAIKLRSNPELPQSLVEQAMYLGSEVEYIINIQGQRLTAADNEPHLNRLFAEGEAVGVDFISQAVHILPRDK